MNIELDRWKLAFAMLAVGSICAIGYLGIHLFDNSATLGMLRDHDQRTEAALSVLRAAMPEAWRMSGRSSQSEMLAILQKQNPAARIVTNPTTIEMDQIRFCFSSNGLLDRIERTDDYGTTDGDLPSNRPAIH
jgi:hypothetical protein